MAIWIIDSDHSCAAFAIRHLMIAHVRGQFNKMKGTIVFDPEKKDASSVQVEIDVATVTTGIRKRDDHLLTADFFDQSKFPLITFKSRQIEFLDNKRARITGDLTLHGVTRQVVFNAEYAGPVKSPMGGEITMGFSAATKINREEFGMMWGSEELEGGGLLTGKDVHITLDVEADLAG
jgi:polyisoprenoid-binding protein YceI